MLITEFLAKNETGLLDEDGDFSDWIELHNPTSTPVDLAGWGLSDDALDLMQWTFPDVSIAGGEYLVVFASDKDRVVAGSPLHTNFKLGGNGEFLGLTRADGSVQSSYDPAYPIQSDDISYGLQVDFVTEAFFDPPTPGAVNQTGVERLGPVDIAMPRGVYNTFFGPI